MSEFRGLHNPERHKGNQPDTRCVRCHGGYEVCAPDAACYCCLQAEVEALRAQVQRVRDAIALHDGGMIRGTYILDILDGGVPLDNYGRHEPDMLGAIARCATCGDTGGLCHPDSPCRCCLAAEVESLRAALSGLGQRVFDAENTLANVRECVDALRQWPLWANRDDYINALVRALDGGNT